VCFKRLNAEYVEQNNKVYFKKTCREHGNFSELVSRDSKNFIEFHKYYNFYLSNKFLHTRTKRELSLFPSYKCNLNCPICITKSNPQSNDCLTIKELQPIVKKFRRTYINIMGGEPTVYPYLEELVALIKRYKSKPVLFTNGLVLTDRAYVKRLKKIGVKIVNIQFDCTKSADRRIRGTGQLLEKKNKAIRNLNLENFDIHLEVTLEKGINSESINELINYAIKFENILSINIRPYFKLGKLENRDCMTMDDMIDSAKNSTKGVITKEKIQLLQKFLLLLPTKKPEIDFCAKHRYYILVRENMKFVDIFKYFRINKIENDMKIYMKQGKINILRKICFIIKIFPKICTIKSIKLFFNLMKDRISNVKNRLLFIDFNGRCDLTTFDENDLCPSRVYDICGGFSKKFNIANIKREKIFNKK